MKFSNSTVSDRIFDIFVTIFLAFMLLVVAYPLYFVLISSFSDPNLVNSGQVVFAPKGINFTGYKFILEDDRIWTGYRNTIFYASGFALLSVIMSLFTGYALSKENLVGKKVITFYFLITMYFHGGLIPTYLVVKNLNLINKPYVMILLGSVSVFHIILSRTYFKTSIPGELLEAAKIDGCNEAQYLFGIVMPLSKPLIAVLLLYCIVGQWNSYFQALIYLNETKFFPLQLFLRDILVASRGLADMTSDIESIAEREKVAELVKFGVIIISSAPLLIIYPFLQRYFVRGVMIGAVKG